MQQADIYPQVPAPVNKHPALFAGSIRIGGSPVLLEADNLKSIMALAGLAMQAKYAERPVIFKGKIL